MRFVRHAAAAALLLSLASIAQAQKAEPAAPGLRAVNPAGLPKPNGYSHAIEVPAGRTLYISGQLPIDKNGDLVGEGDFGAQAEQVFANLETALEASGASFKDVVKLNMFVTDMRQLKALREARDKYIDLGKPPASTLVEVKRFVKDGAMVEIDAVAVVSPSGTR